jgi:hypothetical protein
VVAGVDAAAVRGRRRGLALGCDPPLVQRLLDDELALGPAASVEAHLIDCAACRTLVADATDPVALEPAWLGIGRRSSGWPTTLPGQEASQATDSQRMPGNRAPSPTTSGTVVTTTATARSAAGSSSVC